MGKERHETKPPAQSSQRKPPGGEEFPETVTLVLREAAAGRWEAFLATYLQPCWREVVLACRAHQIPLPDADDLFQELMVRLVKDAGFGRRAAEEMARLGEDANFHGNLPGRYLKYHELPLRAARFRTYLKATIHNLVLETLRQRRREPKSLEEPSLEGVEPWIEASITVGLDRAWCAECVEAAVTQLRDECAQATTKGSRRLLDLLYLTVVERRSVEQIAEHFDVDRTTVSHLLKQARVRLVTLLAAVSGTTEPDELKALVKKSSDDLTRVLARLSPLAPPSDPGQAG